MTVAVVGLVALAAGIVAGGRTIGVSGGDGSDIPIEIEDIPLEIIEEEPETGAAETDEAATVAAVPATAPRVELKPAPEPAGDAAPTEARPAAGAPEIDIAVAPVAESVPAKPLAMPRSVSSSIVVPPAIDPQDLQRIEPREPLSKLALAKPPKPKMPDDWKGTPLHRPVVNEAGRFQSMGYTVAIAGTESVPADAMCDYEGKSWNCGVRARTAFRLFLRGRSPICAVPPEADREIVMANCRMGKQDIGVWLVANGWVRAAATGPYVEAGEKAIAEKKGIFGPPPEALPQMAAPTVTIAPAEFVSPLDPSADVAEPEAEPLTPADPLAPSE